MMVLVGPTDGSFAAAVDSGDSVVDVNILDKTSLAEEFGKLFVAFRHCRYVVLKMVKKYYKTNSICKL